MVLNVTHRALPGIAQRIIQRGNNRHTCFAESADYAGYLQEFADASLKKERKERRPEGAGSECRMGLGQKAL